MSDTITGGAANALTDTDHGGREISAEAGQSLSRQRANGAAPRKGEGTNVGRYERWASLVAGGALVFYGLTKQRKTPLGAGLAIMGGGLLHRGATGHCQMYSAMSVSTAGAPQGGIRVERVVTIDKSPEELYAFWRNFENLPRIMDHLVSVTQTDDSDRSHWVAKAPANQEVAWDAEIVQDRANEYIAWRSLEGADVDNAGSVSFAPATGGRGTEVRVTLTYDPPAGLLGSVVAKLFGEEPSIQIDKDLRRFKMLMETGEIATTEGQPVGRAKN